MRAATLASACETARVQVVLIDVPAGDRTAGELGLAGLPGRGANFSTRSHCRPTTRGRSAARRSTAWQVAAQTRRCGCAAGTPSSITALRAADYLANRDVGLLTEVLNPVDVPGFLLSRSTEGQRLLAETGHPNLKLQFDLYHRVAAGEDWEAELLMQLSRIGHIPFSDYPGRHQPGTGDQDWPRIFSVLRALDYAGHVGCEYFPLEPTVESFGWRGLASA